MKLVQWIKILLFKLKEQSLDPQNPHKPWIRVDLKGSLYSQFQGNGEFWAQQKTSIAGGRQRTNEEDILMSTSVLFPTHTHYIHSFNINDERRRKEGRRGGEKESGEREEKQKFLSRFFILGSIQVLMLLSIIYTETVL